MAEEGNQEADQTVESGTPIELTDQELWDQTGETQAAPSEETVDVTEAEPEPEQEQPTEVLEVEHPKEEAKPAHDYEKRYKDLEKEFHKRNEESARLREEFQQLRVERLELQKKIDDAGKIASEEAKKPKAPDPAEDSYFTEDDRQTMDDFSEITGVVKKLIQHEMAKGRKDLPLDAQQEEIATLKKSVEEYQQQQFLVAHDKHMRETVGEDYREIDRTDEFYDYVMASPIRKQAMTESRDARDHAAVMLDFLNTEAGRKFRQPEEPKVEEEPKKPDPPPENPEKQARRAAASGLLKNTAKPVEKRTDDLSDQELWDSI